MRTIERTSQFRRDYKREAKGLHRLTLEKDFITVVTILANDQPLSEKYRDHALSGDWKNCRDCHIKPDLILIYRKLDDAVLQLVRLGSHSELGLWKDRCLSLFCHRYIVKEIQAVVLIAAIYSSISSESCFFAHSTVCLCQNLIEFATAKPF